MKKIIISTAFALALTGCKSVNRTAQNTPETANAPISTGAEVSSPEFFNAINKKSDFQQVKISSKIQADMGAFAPPADATIYIENGKKVWMNLGVAFMNIARGVATPNGIQGYEKLTKSYIDSDFSYLNRMMNVNFINYNSFQNLLIGKTTVPVNSEDFILTKNMSGYTLTSKNPQKVAVNGKSSAYSISLDYSPQYDLSRLVMQDTATTDKVEINYSNWAAFGSERFPQNVKIILKGQKTGQILIENTKFDFSKMETPYSVPNDYTKKEIR